ncbi:MAG: hypothetical protein GWO16_02600, partial [Gammaproteobacteria bacterium]|nr:hypothetical protein [Gammaproteobacteria bacterium]NIR97026.1 hypothetical protein [Gammaproteobacteria bacterium]NIT62724.1 hypothetical protein [Gammaproteobacteria bacterium]NIV19682.1 hypothetical protein [Gammaproteobacteria bacterium]NIX11012.1 hypothetical protein [Gammaproteobacteria bacterium]
PPPADTGGTLEELEVAAIRRMLGETGGNMSRAAERLNIGRATLYR